MKKILSASAFLALIPLMLSFYVSGPIPLRLNLKEGSTYAYHTAMKQDISTELGGKDIKSHTNMEQDIDLKVVRKFGSDSLLLNAAYRRMALQVSAMGHETTFDSDKTNDQNRQLQNLFTAMKNNPVEMVLSPAGQILDIRGTDKLLEAVNHASSQGNPVVQKVLDHLLNKENFKNSFSGLSLLPSKPISVGNRWEHTLEISSIAPLRIHTLYTVKEILPDHALLDVSGDITGVGDSATFNGISVPIKVKGTQAGTYNIDRATGLPSSGNIRQDIHIKMSVMGNEVQMEIKGKTNITSGLKK